MPSWRDGVSWKALAWKIHLLSSDVGGGTWLEDMASSLRNALERGVPPPLLYLARPAYSNAAINWFLASPSFREEPSVDAPCRWAGQCCPRELPIPLKRKDPAELFAMSPLFLPCPPCTCPDATRGKSRRPPCGARPSPPPSSLRPVSCPRRPMRSRARSPFTSPCREPDLHTPPLSLPPPCAAAATPDESCEGSTWAALRGGGRGEKEER